MESDCQRYIRHLDSHVSLLGLESKSIGITCYRHFDGIVFGQLSDFLTIKRLMGVTCWFLALAYTPHQCTPGDESASRNEQERLPGRAVYEVYVSSLISYRGQTNSLPPSCGCDGSLVYFGASQQHSECYCHRTVASLGVVFAEPVSKI
jgi:hypothetical protein